MCIRDSKKTASELADDVLRRDQEKAKQLRRAEQAFKNREAERPYVHKFKSNAVHRGQNGVGDDRSGKGNTAPSTKPRKCRDHDTPLRKFQHDILTKAFLFREDVNRAYRVQWDDIATERIYELDRPDKKPNGDYILPNPKKAKGTVSYTHLTLPTIYSV